MPRVMEESKRSVSFKIKRRQMQDPAYLKQSPFFNKRYLKELSRFSSFCPTKGYSSVLYNPHHRAIQPSIRPSLSVRNHNSLRAGFTSLFVDPGSTLPVDTTTLYKYFFGCR